MAADLSRFPLLAEYELWKLLPFCKIPLSLSHQNLQPFPRRFVSVEFKNSNNMERIEVYCSVLSSSSWEFRTLLSNMQRWLNTRYERIVVYIKITFTYFPEHKISYSQLITFLITHNIYSTYQPPPPGTDSEQGGKLVVTMCKMWMHFCLGNIQEFKLSFYFFMENIQKKFSSILMAKTTLITIFGKKKIEVLLVNTKFWSL